MSKNILLGVVIPVILIASGIGLAVLLQAPEPLKSPLANPENEGELLAFLPIADVEEVKLLSDTLDVSVSGTVVPYRELQLAAEVAGKIIEKDPQVRSGNYVQQGQILYRIEAEDYELDLARLTQRKDQELASIQELEQDIENTNSLLAVAEDQLALSEADVSRLENLRTNFSSAAELDDARRNRLTNMNQKVTLENQLRTLKTRQSRLRLAVKLAETEIKQAQLSLARTVVRSPVDGRIVSDSVETDSFVQRGTQLVVIEDTEKVEVACNLRMDQLSWVLQKPEASTDRLISAAQASRYELPDTAAEVKFRVAGRDSEAFIWEGRLDRFDGTGIDPASRTVPLRIRVDTPSRFTLDDGTPENSSGPPVLVRGMFVEVTIKATPTTPLMLVPKLGIKPATNSNVIWKFKNSRDAIRATPKALESIKAYEQAQKDGNVDEVFPEKTDDENDETEVIDPADWIAGNLEVIPNVRLVASYWEDTPVEYWVCEVTSDALNAGDQVIISPLPGVKADGTDGVRVKKVSDAEELADQNETGPEVDTEQS